MSLPVRSRLALGLPSQRCIGLFSSPSQASLIRRSSRPTPTTVQQLLKRSYTAAAAGATSGPSPPSRLRRIARAAAVGSLLVTAGFVFGAAPAAPTLGSLLSPPTHAETLALFAPQTDAERAAEAFIQNHPLAAELRARPGFVESRPHLRIPASFRAHNLTGGTLLGAGKVTVPPLAFAEEGGRSLVSITHLGAELCGHPGIVHGGLLATLLDEGLARCCFAALPHHVAMTARLNINYRAPTPAGAYVVLRATTTKVEGRKAWVEGRLETLPANGEAPVVLAEADALFISPKQAAVSLEH